MMDRLSSADSLDPSPTPRNLGGGPSRIILCNAYTATIRGRCTYHGREYRVQDSTPVLAPVPGNAPIVEHVLLLKGHVLLTDQ